MNDLFAAFKTVPAEQKKGFGQALNQLKQAAQRKLDECKDFFENTEDDGEKIDLSRPVSLDNLGSRHPVSLVRNEIVEIFKRIGFNVSEGPEMEDDWHNFTALNLQRNTRQEIAGHFLYSKNPDVLLRTHTSSVQVLYGGEYASY